MASACQLTKLGIEGSTRTWISYHIRMCLRVRDLIPCQHPDWNDSYAEGGALIDGTYTKYLL